MDIRKKLKKKVVKIIRTDVKAIFFSAILPAESPRTIQRLNPIFRALDYETSFFSFRKKILINDHWKDFLKMFYKRNDIIICMDPLSLLICNILLMFKKNNKIYIYDRNERWPYNWKNRSNFFQKFFFKIPKIFIFFEKMLLKKVKFLISTDTITVKDFNLKKFIIPNRIYYPIPSIDSEKENFILYFGTFSKERGSQEILRVFSENFLIKKNLNFKIFTRNKFHQNNLKKSKIKYHEFSNSEDTFREASKGLLGIVYQKNLYKNTMSILPSKISTYWQLNLPIVIIGDNKKLKKLESFYPNAIKYFNPDNFTFDFDKVIKWAKSAKINFKPRDIKLQKLKKLLI